MPKTKPEKINVTFTLDPDIVQWLDDKVAKTDLNRSQHGRAIFREKMEAEKLSRRRKVDAS